MSPVLYESKDRVAIITINRSAKRNAINEEVCAGLREAWLRLAAGEDRVAVLTGAGDAAFSSGVDLSDPPKALARCLPNVGVELEKPVIAAVSGWCVGGAMLFVMLADLAVASETTRFAFPEAKLGLFGGVMSSLVTRIPHKFAMEMLLLGEEMDAPRAREVGLVNRVVPAGTHLEAALDLAARIASNAPLVMQAVKHFALETLARGPVERVQADLARLEQIASSEDLAEGKRAFAERRPPRFKGK